MQIILSTAIEKSEAYLRAYNTQLIDLQLRAGSVNPILSYNLILYQETVTTKRLLLS